MRYISLKFENIYNWCIHCGFLCFGHRTSANIDSQLYKLWDSVARMQSDLRSDEDMSFMTYSELQFFSFYHRNKPHEKHPQLERKCMSVSVEGNSFSEETAFQHWAVIPVYVSGSSFSLNLRKLNCIHNTRISFLCKLCVQSPHQGSRAPYQDCRLKPSVH